MLSSVVLAFFFLIFVSFFVAFSIVLPVRWSGPFVLFASRKSAYRRIGSVRPSIRPSEEKNGGRFRDFKIKIFVEMLTSYGLIPRECRLEVASKANRRRTMVSMVSSIMESTLYPNRSPTSNGSLIKK